MTSQTDAITEPRGVIEYRDVHKSFDVPVLAGIDLTVFRSPRPLVEDADVPSDDLALAVAKEALRRRVQGLDVSQLVDGDDAVDRAPQDRTQPRLALAKRFR